MGELREQRLAALLRHPRMSAEQALDFCRRLVRQNTSSFNEADVTGEGAHEPADWTDPDAPTCERCGGSGWLRQNVPAEQVHTAGLIECGTCGVVAARRRRTIWASAQLPKRMTSYTFDGYLAAGGKASVVEALRAWQPTTRWGVLSGGVGVGKTGLAICLLKEHLDAGGDGLYVVAPDFLDRIRSTYSNRDDVTEDEVFGSLVTAPLLVLDDLGVDEELSPWARSKLFRLINRRLLDERRTLITTNLPPEPETPGEESLASYLGLRVWDRVRGESDIWVLTGESLRGRAA